MHSPEIQDVSLFVTIIRITRWWQWVRISQPCGAKKNQVNQVIDIIRLWFFTSQGHIAIHHNIKPKQVVILLDCNWRWHLGSTYLDLIIDIPIYVYIFDILLVNFETRKRWLCQWFKIQSYSVMILHLTTRYCIKRYSDLGTNENIGKILKAQTHISRPHGWTRLCICFIVCREPTVL